MSGSNTITLTLGQQSATIPYTEVNTTEVPTVSNQGTQYGAIQIDATHSLITYYPLELVPGNGIDVVTVKLSDGSSFAQNIQVVAPPPATITEGAVTISPWNGVVPA